MYQLKTTLRIAAVLLAGCLSARVLAIDPPAAEASRFAMKTNYLQTPEEGIYEMVYDGKNNRVFAAAMDRVNREANQGYLYAFSASTLAVENRQAMPYRAFSLAINPSAGQLYVGHTQSASLRISLVDAATGQVVKTSEKLTFGQRNMADARFEHLRHMVYSPTANTLFVSYSNMLNGPDGTKPVHKLLMLDGTTLKLLGEVHNAYNGTAYGLTIDNKTQKIYVGGKDYVNEIDAATKTVLRTISLQNVKPKITSVQNLIVDSASNRIFVVVFDHEDRSGPHDGLYVFNLQDGKQLGYVHTGAGSNAVRFNPKYNELYVTNFTSGTLSVVDAKGYQVTKTFKVPVYPNQMVLSEDLDTLYVGVKEGFNRQWDPDVFVEGAKERILRISLDKP